MNLADRLHCPECKGRLATMSAAELNCTVCGRPVPLLDGTGDFSGEPPLKPADPRRYGIDPATGEAPIPDLLARVRAAAGTRWPEYLGDVLELGCGIGQMTHALMASQPIKTFLAVDTALQNIRACRERLATHGAPDTVPIGFAVLSGREDAIRDAMADMVLGVNVLIQTGDIKALLATVHRALKPGGKAWFIVPNRRYRQAMCQAMATALVRRHARDHAWPAETHAAVGAIARMRLLLVHQDDAEFLNTLEQKHLFDNEALEDLALEAGFASAEAIPLDPDPAGAVSTGKLFKSAGLSDDFTADMAPLAAAAGKPYFDLLARRDASSFMLVWLTKAAGPRVRIFTAPPVPPAPPPPDLYAGAGGANPRWSIELLARDTPDGIMVQLGGWCLANTDVRWVRVTLDDTARLAPVWRPRPDVHEVLNGAGLYHPLNTLCSGLESGMLFSGVHPPGDEIPFRLDVVLANGIVLTGANAPKLLRMHEQLVLAQ